MRVLQSWLSEYIDFPFSPEVLADRLSMLGLEIEGIEHLGKKYKGFVVGKVVERVNHPNADRLSVCNVNIGKEVLQVVCGAANVAPGQKVAVGLVGATVPRNQHDPSGKPFVLSHVKIRGVESSGMICSAYELDLGDDADGILLLKKNARVGQPLASYLGLDDVAYDVEITANRPDWLSHLGVAREIGVLTGKKPVLPHVKLKEGMPPIGRFLKVDVLDRANCLRFSARMIRGVTLGPSPQWLQDRLTRVGLRPRNNVVDITNYVMLECGQPLHAFDYALLKGSTIVVRQAGQASSFETLDGKQHHLPLDAVMVCDAEREVSIAGIMGGANSEINDATSDIVLESAYWNPASIRKTRRVLGITTDASQRFERGADPGATLYALDRAAGLILDIAGGELLKGTIDVHAKTLGTRSIALRPARVNAVLGTSLSSSDIKRNLELLGLKQVSKGKNSHVFSIPTFRADLEREIDLIEEVARVHGYDNIGIKTTSLIDFSHPFPKSDRAVPMRSALVGMGYQEAITNSLQSSAKASLATDATVSVKNPSSQELATLRTSLIPGLLDVVALNRNQGNTNLRFFEIGHVYRRDRSGKPKLVEDYLEEERICLMLTGLAEPKHWSAPPRTVDLFDLKGDVEGFLEQITLDKGRFISYSTTETLAESALAIEINGSYAGYLGKVRREILDLFTVEQEVFVAELETGVLPIQGTRRYSPLPRFPRVVRDVAFLVDEAVPAGSVEEAIRQSASSLLRTVELFDIYEGDRLDSGKKSLAFSLELMSVERTLTDQEVDAEMEKIVRSIEREFHASLRSV